MAMIKDSFDEFIESIPVNIHCNTQSYLSRNVAIFIPEEFVIHKRVKMFDYHFVIYHTTPPPILIGNTSVQFRNGNIMGVEPGVYLEVSAKESLSKESYISISIKKDFFSNIAHEIVDMEEIRFERKGKPYSHRILELIKLWINEIVAFGENCQPMIESIETLIVIQLLRDTLSDRLIKGKSRFSNNDYITKAIDYMNEYYSSNITIAEICKSIYISPCHFQRIFKKDMDQTPYNYLMEIRVNKAKERLLEDTISIEEVARLCGFVSSAHFSSAFKRMEGISPSAFRNSKNG